MDGIFPGGSQTCALEALFGEFREETSTVLENEPRMVFGPFKNLGELVSRIVVDDHMHGASMR